VITATCHCGAVRFSIPRKPETLTNCSCSICRRYGVLWAYYTQDEVTVEASAGGTEAYSWDKKSIQFVRCTSCGCITHWEPIVEERGSRMGVNARLFEPEQLGAVRIRRLDGAVTESYLD